MLDIINHVNLLRQQIYQFLSIIMVEDFFWGTLVNILYILNIIYSFYIFMYKIKIFISDLMDLYLIGLSLNINCVVISVK
jgi:hypothetical protein